MDDKRTEDNEKAQEMAERKRRIMEITKQYADAMEGPPICLEEFLYDERGLPK